MTSADCLNGKHQTTNADWYSRVEHTAVVAAPSCHVFLRGRAECIKQLTLMNGWLPKSNEKLLQNRLRIGENYVASEEG
jgi:hypothetical protein